jgi:hypothetical protein
LPSAHLAMAGRKHTRGIERDRHILAAACTASFPQKRSSRWQHRPCAGRRSAEPRRNDSSREENLRAG